MAKDLKVTVTVSVTLDEAAQEAWMSNFHVERGEIRGDVKAYFGNQVSGNDFTDIIGAPIKIGWK